MSLPSRLDETSTVSPSMRPLTKRLSFSALFVVLAQPANISGRTIASTVHFRFIASSLPLLAVGLFGLTNSSSQVGACQPERVHRSYACIISFGNAVLCVHHLRVVGYALGKSLSRQLHFFPRELYVCGAGFHFLACPFHSGNRVQHVRLDLCAQFVLVRLCFPQQALRLLNLSANAPSGEDGEVECAVHGICVLVVDWRFSALRVGSTDAQRWVPVGLRRFDLQLGGTNVGFCCAEVR